MSINKGVSGMSLCWYCNTHAECTRSFRGGEQVAACEGFVGATDICDYCDKSVEANHEVRHTESKQTLFVCDSCIDYMRMDTNQFWREVL
jgi:hypothetical protein